MTSAFELWGEGTQYERLLMCFSPADGGSSTACLLIMETVEGKKVLKEVKENNTFYKVEKITHTFNTDKKKGTCKT